MARDSASKPQTKEKAMTNGGQHVPEKKSQGAGKAPATKQSKTATKTSPPKK
jgi:hypothetical protein